MVDHSGGGPRSKERVAMDKEVKVRVLATRVPWRPSKITVIFLSHGNCCPRKPFLSGKEMKLSNYNLITVHRVFIFQIQCSDETTQIHRSSKTAF